MRFVTREATHKGLVRSNNEDSVLNTPPLVAVADGMGGYEGGEIASSLTLEVLESWVPRLAERGGQALKDAVLDANRTVWSRGKSEPHLAAMGTTLTAGWIQDNTVTVAHVGDSRAYLLRSGQLSQLTQDQTMVQQLVSEGRIAADEAARHPQRSMLLQAIGSDPNVQVDVLNVTLRPGDRLLLASDGLHGYVEDERIRDILGSTEDLAETCRLLVEVSNEAGGHDNVSVVVLEAQAEEGEAIVEDERAPTDRVIVSKEPSGGTDRGRKGRKLSALVPLAIVAAVAVALLGYNFLQSASTQYFVVARGDRVAIVEGVAGRDGGPPRGRVVRRTDLQVSTLVSTYQRDLKEGIPARSLEDAQRVVSTLPRIQPQAATPEPTAAPAPTPTAAPPPPPPA
ncbi:MAG TPA: Stp1/IreP family PP2C-type Ser/Thr phosphatase [Actinomycetota bacterium]|nr:Stp1/IreP family PP2C-type Ser/Thr phosphatase [Actinomycetota bacterium]